jgi:LmbE family N-acetylglucosaminyl deacetylase
MSRTVLAIGAHPDDIEFSCTGTLMKLMKEGYEIYYVIATNGESGFKTGIKTRKERVKIRHTEQLNAARKLGIKKVFFLGYKDGFLHNSDDLRRKLVIIIKKLRPEIIFTFDPANTSFGNLNLNHRDHRNIGISVFDAVFAAKNKYMYPGKPHRVNVIYFFGSHKPDCYVNINKYLKRKIEILREHKSQFSDFDEVEDWIREHLSRFSKKYKYSEAFRVVKVLQIFK